jgi:hypothetical protein
VKVFLGLHKTVDDKWTSRGDYLEEPAGILCRFDDGSAVVVTFDGRVLRFDARGIQVPVAGEDPQDSDPDCAECGFRLPRHDKDCTLR